MKSPSRSTYSSILGGTKADYVPHHNWFQYYPTTANLAHTRPTSTAVIGQTDEDTGQSICAFVTLEGDLAGSDELVEEIRARVGDRIGKFARPKRIIWADDLPKTRSGKIMRRLLRDIAEGRALGDVTTLRDPDVMAQLEGKIKEEQAAEA